MEVMFWLGIGFPGCLLEAWIERGFLLHVPVGYVVEDVIFNQGLHFSFFGIYFAGCHNGDCVFCIKPADFSAMGIIYCKDSPVELMRMLFLLDGSNDL